ncbi:MAG: response regulator [Desulfobacteraceae bacterium]|nr:MAG: response regulator [Desulfobacteraceae bacterium]
MNILIVEDDSDVASVLRRSLAAIGYKAEQAATCSEAIKKIQLYDFDLILLDLFLPDGMGYELIPRLKALDPGLNVIAMTAHNSRELETRVRRQGVLFYLIKPFEFKYLENILIYMAERKNINAEKSEERTTFFRSLECGGKTPLFKARHVALSQSADMSAQSK